MNKAQCPYCGQYIMVEAEENLEEAAVKMCNCVGAQREKKILKSMEQANDNIEIEFHNVSEAAVGILKAAVKPVALGKVASVVVNIGNGIKGAVTTTNRGTIKVSKTVTKKVEHDE